MIFLHIVDFNLNMSEQTAEETGPKKDQMTEMDKITL
jgi:hypothetical protein